MKESIFLLLKFGHTFCIFQIWDMSDEEHRGFLDRRGFFVALKFIALQQCGLELSKSSLTKDIAAPDMVPTYLYFLVVT